MSVEGSDYDLQQAVAVASALSSNAGVMWRHYCTVNSCETLMAVSGQPVQRAERVATLEQDNGEG